MTPHPVVDVPALLPLLTLVLFVLPLLAILHFWITWPRRRRRF